MLPLSLNKIPCLRVLLPLCVGIALSSNDKHHNLGLVAIGCGALLYILALLGQRLFCRMLQERAWAIRQALLITSLSLIIGGIGASYTQLRLNTGQAQTAQTAIQVRLTQALQQSPQISSEVQTLLAGICLGYMPKGEAVSELRQAFSLSGAAHILAVSGFHLGVVVFALGMLIRLLRLPPPLYRILLIVGAWAFTVLVGFNIPTVRAAIMLTLFILGTLLDRERYTPNILAASLLIQLIIDPQDLYRWGIWLSYTAVLSIYLFYARLRSLLGYIRQPILRYLWEALSLSLAAQVLTLPLCLHLFGFISWSFIFTTIPFTLLSSLLIPLGLIAYLFAYIGISLPLLSKAIEILGTMMIDLSKWGASLDALVLRIDFPLWAMLGLWAVALSAHYLFTKPRPSY